MRYFVAPLILASLLMVNQNAEAQNLESDSEKMGYAIGRQMGEFIKNNGVEIDDVAFLRGLDEGMEGIKSALTNEQLQAAYVNYQKTAQAKQAEMAKEKSAEAIKEGETFLAENGARKEVITTASGLQYEVIRKGTGATPAANDTVSTHYRGTLINGEEFDSSYSRNEPAEFPVNRVIPGWTEALQLMKTGAKWKLFIPYQLAYGEQGSPPRIPGGSALVFDIELLEIK
jgi:FKBP-type peptidyl-prolyl cis-trans isomerase